MDHTAHGPSLPQSLPDDPLGDETVVRDVHSGETWSVAELVKAHESTENRTHDQAIVEVLNAVARGDLEVVKGARTA